MSYVFASGLVTPDLIIAFNKVAAFGIDADLKAGEIVAGVEPTGFGSAATGRADFQPFVADLPNGPCPMKLADMDALVATTVHSTVIMQRDDRSEWHILAICREGGHTQQFWSPYLSSWQSMSDRYDFSGMDPHNRQRACWFDRWPGLKETLPGYHPYWGQPGMDLAKLASPLAKWPEGTVPHPETAPSMD